MVARSRHRPRCSKRHRSDGNNCGQQIPAGVSVYTLAHPIWGGVVSVHMLARHSWEGSLGS
jgi:hypothetical protein